MANKFPKILYATSEFIKKLSAGSLLLVSQAKRNPGIIIRKRLHHQNMIITNIIHLIGCSVLKIISKKFCLSTQDIHLFLVQMSIVVLVELFLFRQVTPLCGVIRNLPKDSFACPEIHSALLLSQETC